MISTAFVDGAVLAAMVHDDASGAALAGFAPGIARAIAARRAELDALSRPERHEVTRALVREITAVSSDVEVPPRAAAILANDVERAVARAWTKAAPPVRRGFRVTRGLRITLRRLVGRASPDAEARELAAGERIDALPSAVVARLRSIARDRRTLGALVLGAEGDVAGDASSRRLRAIGHEIMHVWRAPWR